MKIVVLLILITSLAMSCKNGKRDDVGKSNFVCPYNALASIDNKEVSKSGNSVTGKVEFVIKSNLKKLGEGELSIEGGDTSFLGRVDKILNERTNYSAEFFEKHNSIIQILCAIEKDLKDTSISQATKDLLFKEKVEKRTMYFDFILEKEKNQATISDNNVRAVRGNSKITKPVEKEIVTSEPPTVINNYGNLSTDQKGGKVEQTIIVTKPPQRHTTSEDIQQIISLVPNKDFLIKVFCVQGNEETQVIRDEILEVLFKLGYTNLKIGATQSFTGYDKKKISARILTYNQEKFLEVIVNPQ